LASTAGPAVKEAQPEKLMKAAEAKITEPVSAEPPKKAKDRQQEAMDNFAQVFQKHQSKVILKPTLATGQRRSTRVRYQVEPM